jgi:hypothetical protein
MLELVSERSRRGAQRLTDPPRTDGNPRDSRTESCGTRLAVSTDVTRRWVRQLGLDRWRWRTCWKSVEFWLVVGSIVLPGGFFLLLLPRHPLRITLRRSRS